MERRRLVSRFWSTKPSTEEVYALKELSLGAKALYQILVWSEENNTPLTDAEVAKMVGRSRMMIYWYKKELRDNGLYRW